MSMQKHLTGLYLALICTVIITAPGCKKDSKGSSTSNSSALFSGAWKMSTFEVLDGGGTWHQTAPPSLLADQALIFKSDGTYEATSGGTHSYNGTWSTFNDGKSITITSTTYDITTLTSDSMVLTNSHESFAYSVNGVASTYYGERDTYTH